MSPYIYQKLILSGSMSGSYEQGVRFSNSAFARTFGISNWTKIRLGFRYRVQLTGSSLKDSGILSGAPRFTFGFCHGTDYIPGDWYVEQFIGFGWNDDNTVLSSGMFQIAGNNNINTNLVTSSATAGITYSKYDDAKSFGQALYITTGSYAADILFMDIERSPSGSSIFKASMFGRTTSATSSYYYPYENFITDLQVSVPSRINYSYVQLTGITMSQEPTYPLDSICFMSDRTDPEIEIIDVYVVRLT